MHLRQTSPEECRAFWEAWERLFGPPALQIRVDYTLAMQTNPTTAMKNAPEKNKGYQELRDNPLLFDDEVTTPEAAATVIRRALARDLVLVRATDPDRLRATWDLLREAAGDRCYVLYLPGIDSLIVTRAAWFWRWTGCADETRKV